ncbi:PfkB family carbohydrate kinase [Marmoricola sp. RAF53]|uniref:PfkB family carbohydrate kinase n=1 Tax=Marmoricola sp. RAF53 TaxID=3233059 RepID=UPI003F97D8F2
MILVAGESLVDLVDGVPSPGGSLANVAVSLARLGAPVRLLTAYADDADGRLLDEHLAAAGVRFAADPHVLARTSRAVATLGADGAATYTFDLDGALPVPDPGVTWTHLHLGSIGALVPPGADVVAGLAAELRATATISYDLNARPAAVPVDAAARTRIEALVRLSDVVKASDEDLLAWRPDSSVEESAAHLLDLGVGAVVLTLGPAGSRCLTALGEVLAPAEPVAVVDTIGAGDTFIAAVVDGLRRRDLLGGAARDALATLPLATWEEVLRRAGRASAITVSRRGADPPTAAELDV